MDIRDAKDLLHLRDWRQLVEQIVGDGQQAYSANALAQEAGDALMMKVGEAAKRLASRGIEAPAAIDWSDAVANRNWVIHQYDEVDRDVTWATLRDSMATWRTALAPLVAQAEAVLGIQDGS